jgi:hypothetical protein
MIRQLTSKPFCFTKICRIFQSTKHFVKYFFLYSRRESNPHGHKAHKILSLACLPIPPPEHFTNMSKNLCLLFHKDNDLFETTK